MMQCIKIGDIYYIFKTGYSLRLENVTESLYWFRNKHQEIWAISRLDYEWHINNNEAIMLNTELRRLLFLDAVHKS